MNNSKRRAYSVECIAYSVERIAYSKKLNAIRYPCLTGRQALNAKIFCILVCSFAFCILYSYCFAQPVSSAELINNAKQYDGKTVVYGGEIIGDIMARGKYSWINALDGAMAIGIWSDNDLINDIQYSGGYRAQGDWIEVEGVFHRACLEHGGDLDIHAKAMRKVKSGRVKMEKVNVGEIKAILLLFALLCVILALKSHKPKKT